MQPPELESIHPPSPPPKRATAYSDYVVARRFESEWDPGETLMGRYCATRRANIQVEFVNFMSRLNRLNTHKRQNSEIWKFMHAVEEAEARMSMAG